MVKRSLQASFPGIQQAKRAFARKGWTQENLAGEVGLKTRQSIWRFFTGQPIERQIFLEICLILGLDWREIALDPPAEFPEPRDFTQAPTTDIETLVRQVRSQRQHKIQDQCGTLQLLNISSPVSIDALYIHVNILEEIPSRQWLELADLQRTTPQEFDRVGLREESQTQIAGMKAAEIYSKLRVLGKPGAGKTTFLQHLAIRCNQGSFAANRVAIFINLRDFTDEARATAEFSLLSYIRGDFLASGISDPSTIEILLREGRVLLLLDGLDEVLDQDCRDMVTEISRLSEKYPQNLFVVTCRTAAKALNLRRFTDVEMAPFTQAQILAFARKWFTALTKTTPDAGQQQATQFVEKLSLPENLPFRKLAVTPLFLHLACWVFQSRGNFPTRRSEFYKQCLELLLSRWDESKGIKRDEIYQGFLLPQKLKLLSQVAMATFEQGDYFFAQQVVEQQIEEHIRKLSNAAIEPEELQLDSEGILKAIELQHGLLAERVQGIFSFPYVFQEYFTARKIVANCNLQASNQSLKRLVSHITEPRWREVFLLTVAMLRCADSLVQLMKQKIDAIVADDLYLQEFLTWASQKSLAVPQSTTRAFYLALVRTPDIAAPLVLAYTLDQDVIVQVALEHLVLDCSADLTSNPLNSITVCLNALNQVLATILAPELRQALQQLKDQLPAATQRQETLQTWWQASYPAWLEQLKAAIVKHRDRQHDWHFNSEQQAVLQRYYDANQLLLDCLNSNCTVTAAVRQEIEATLLLPQRELEAREWSREANEPATSTS